MRLSLLILLLLLLCQCATKHQPQVFAPYFALQPEDYFSPTVVSEIRTLEAKEVLTNLEKKRLFDLYSIELRQLKIGSERYKKITEVTDKLLPEIEPLQSEVGLFRVEVAMLNAPEVLKPVIENPKLKKEYQQAYLSWNKDENETALVKVEQILLNSELEKLASRTEWLRILNLRFRVAMDLNRKETIRTAYEELQKYDPCANETAQAGFMVSLLTFAEGDAPKALSIFKGQCDKDDSLTNKIRRAYWMYRFQEKDPEQAVKALQNLDQMPSPGYYSYLAKSTRGEKFSIAHNKQPQPKYLTSELKVPKEVHGYFLKAEESLRANLRRDASVYLSKAAIEMKKNSDDYFLPLLYTAYLFRAAGNHLESMKIHSLFVTASLDRSSEEAKILESEAPDIFPRPFSTTVDWLSRNWGIDPDFVYSIMRQESAFNPGAISQADARGLMQLMPSLGKALAVHWKSQRFFRDHTLFKGEENLKYSTYHLHQLQSVAPHIALMAASYNAGINRVSNWWKRYGNLPLDVFVELIPVNETRNYVKLVLRNYLYYKAFKSDGTVEPGVFSLQLPPYQVGPVAPAVVMPKS